MSKSRSEYATYTPELVNKLKNVTKGLFRADAVKEVAAQLRLSPRQARAIYAKYVEENKFGIDHHKPQIKTETSADKKRVEVKTYEVEELEDVVALCKVDTKLWRVKSFAVNQNSSGAFVWRVSFERDKNAQSIVDDLKADLKQYAPNPVKFKRIPVQGGSLLEIAAFDLHLGKLGYRKEVGSDYDIKIARSIYFDAINQIVEKAKKQGPVARILFPVGNDYLNIDSDSNETTAGTKQDVDSRFSKIYREGRQILVEAIEMLRQTAPVDVVVVPGNHDNLSMFHLGDALECWFHNYEDVKVNNDPISRKYYQFGKVMICLCHGHNEKHDKLPSIAAVEQPKMWASTLFREWHVGHYHHESVKSHYGVKVRVLDSLSGPDRYHFDHGYIGSQRIAQGFRFNEETGLDSIFQSIPVQD